MSSLERRCKIVEFVSFIKITTFAGSAVCPLLSVIYSLAGGKKTCHSNEITSQMTAKDKTESVMQ